MLTLFRKNSLKVKVWSLIFIVLVQGIIVPVKFLTELSFTPSQAQASTIADPFGEVVLSLPEGQETISYTSDILNVDSFYAAQLMWEAGAAKNEEHDHEDEIKAVQFFVKTENSDFQEVVEDVDAEPGVSLPVFTEISKTVQIKVILTKVEDHIPVIQNIRIHTLNPAQDQNEFIPTVSADEKVITRKQWGADESLRLRETRDRIRAENAAKEAAKKPTEPTPTPKPEEPKKETGTKQPTEAEEYGPNCVNLEAKYPDEFKVTKVISNNPDGKAYTWPIAFAPKLRKLVVHHTDIDVKDYDQNLVVDDKDYLAAVKSIYYFHTISRDWGDIGYNYLIDPNGHIYEGRAGGDLAVAAHTLCKNNSALGIALLGNFQNAVPTAKALMALQSLVNAKSKEYHLDPRGSSMFYGNYLPNVIGHRNVRKTSCPGDSLYELLPSLREGTLADTTKLVFPRSTEKLNFDKTVSPVKETEKIYKAEGISSNETIQVNAGEIATLQIKFKNTGNTVWNSDTIVKPINLEKGLTMLKEAKQTQNLVSPGAIATFLPQIATSAALAGKKIPVEFYVVANDLISLSSYKVKVTLNILVVDQNDVSLNTRNAFASQVRQSATNLTQFINQEIGGPTPTLLAKDQNRDANENIRVKLSISEPYAAVEVNMNYSVIVDNKKVAAFASDQKLNILADNQGLLVKAGKNIYRGLVVRVEPVSSFGLVTITNFNHKPEWALKANMPINDNIYRGALEWRVVNGKLTTINELAVEDYLKGLAEVSDSAPFEKQKVMAIIARSYALYYLTKDQKFPGLPYDLDDDPNVSQKYLGYGYEKRSPHFAQAVDATQGLVVSYDNEIVKTPYFSKSDGRTRSAQEVWGWTNTPYLVSVPDPLCQSTDKKLSGHGVGLSGCGAEAAAKRGYSAVEILSYYYPGTRVMKFSQL